MFMTLKLAIPNNPIYNPLAENKLPETDAAHIIRDDEAKIAELMLKNRVDAALLTPISYGRAVADADYRIAPGYCLAASGFTKLASIYFKKGLKIIESGASPTPEDFIIKMGAIILSEKYDIHIDLQKSPEGVDKILEKRDAAIVWGESAFNDPALDVGEEWFANYETPLPLAFWVCRNEEAPENLYETLNMLANTQIRNDVHIFDEETGRSGKLIWTWSDEIEAALDQVFHILYYRQELDEIPKIKILGRE